MINRTTHTLTRRVRANRRDPTTFIFAFSAWPLICAVSLLLPGDIFDTVGLYRTMKSIYPHEDVWGAVMLADMPLLLSSIWSHSVAYRCLVAGISAMLWMFTGCLILFGAYLEGYFSIIGAYSVWGALGCLIAIEQWIYSTQD